MTKKKKPRKLYFKRNNSNKKLKKGHLKKEITLKRKLSIGLEMAKRTAREEFNLNTSRSDQTRPDQTRNMPAKAK